MPDDVEAHAAEVLRRVCDLELKLATAESCTGGLLASVLTDVKGCSHAFERGFVAYSDRAKNELLGVPLELIEDETAVSKPVAIRMAEGGLKGSAAHVCLAVTGYADDADGQAPAGLVHFALAIRDGQTRHECHDFGDRGRGEVRIACIRTALNMIDSATRDPAPKRSVA
jgi:nicotinamide-nucleotide amidase